MVHLKINFMTKDYWNNDLKCTIDIIANYTFLKHI